MHEQCGEIVNIMLENNTTNDSCGTKETTTFNQDGAEETSMLSQDEAKETSMLNQDGAKETTSFSQEDNSRHQKILDMSSKVECLKSMYMVLVNEAKGISFPGSDILNSLQLMSNEFEVSKSKCQLLKKKYLAEFLERKRLYNEVIDLKGNIRVFCRCRPLNSDEAGSGATSIVDFDSFHDNEVQILCSDSSKKQFKFDHVFRPEDTQEAVFAQTSPVVTSVLDGYNVCIFAYGQTGTGKTFTMEGTPENRGVNYRTLEELFRLSAERSAVMKYGLLVSMVEVYNEKIQDLLVEKSIEPTKKLEIKQSSDGTQEVPGLVEACVNSIKEVWELLKCGSQARSVGSTNANKLSSRSHCLLRVTVKGENLVNGQKTKSHLWLVDLAGSERVGKIEVEGERLKESQFINKSLSALGDVISALASKSAHIPYRNSKLTHMLQSSLGGDCKTLMFVQISPSSSDSGETLCSLNFATRVRGVEAGPARKHTDVSELFKYKQLAEKQKHDEKEAKRLQDSLQSIQTKLTVREHICRNLQEKVRELESQLTQERELRLKQETRAFAAASAPTMSVKKQELTTITERKPPLPPSKFNRMPLRRISNFMPPPSQSQPLQKSFTRNSIASTTVRDKENMSRETMAGATNTKTFLQPRRRVSMAVHPPPAAPSATKMPAFLPKRRVSLATLVPDPSSYANTPSRASESQFKKVAASRPSFISDPRKARYSKLFSPVTEVRSVEATPMVTRSSSRFMASPPGSWKPKHPTVVALQKKTLVWSPLKLKALNSLRRSSMLPVRSSSENGIMN